MNLKSYILMAVAFLGGAAQKIETGSPLESFMVISAQNNSWEERYPIGAIIGFALFGLAYVITVIKIFIDINKRKNEYDEIIEDDKAELSRLGLGSRMPEINAELAKVLAGVTIENTGDDQMLGEAAKLKEGEY